MQNILNRRIQRVIQRFYLLKLLYMKEIEEHRETYQSDRYICWVRPYPHLSDKLIEKLLNILGFEFTDDQYGEVDIPDKVISQYPELYKDNSISVESKGSYFYEFSDFETYELLEKKLEKLNKFCSGWCQFNN